MSVITKPQFFGLTNFAIVQGTKFACEASTAPAGLFKGYTMRVSVFDPSLDWKEAFEKRQLLPAAMVTLHPGLRKLKGLGSTIVLQDTLTKRMRRVLASAFHLLSILMR